MQPAPDAEKRETGAKREKTGELQLQSYLFKTVICNAI